MVKVSENYGRRQGPASKNGDGHADVKAAEEALLAADRTLQEWERKEERRRRANENRMPRTRDGWRRAFGDLPPSPRTLKRIQEAREARERLVAARDKAAEALAACHRRQAEAKANGDGHGRAAGSPALEKKGSTSQHFQGGGDDGSLAALKKRFKAYYYFSDDVVIDVVLGVVAGNDLKLDPLWLHLIGPPSIGKTELLLCLQGRPETYFVSQFSANALISGYKDPPEANAEVGKGAGQVKRAVRKRDGYCCTKCGMTNAEHLKRYGSQLEVHRLEPGSAYTVDGCVTLCKGCHGAEPKLAPGEKSDEKTDAPEKGEKDYSLLPLLNGKVLVIKDFTVIHQLPAEVRMQILSQLRDAYDGCSARKVGNSDLKEYSSSFNVLSGMTPSIERDWSLNSLGERFVMLRVTVEERMRHTRRALEGALNRTREKDRPRQVLQKAVADFLNGLERSEPVVGRRVMSWLAHLAEVVSVGRSHVDRDRGGDLNCPPQAELGARLAKQLARLAMGVALVRGRREVTPAEFKVAKRVGLDSLPTNRRRLLAALWEHRKGEEPLAMFRKVLPLAGENTVRRELDNLAALGAVRKAAKMLPTGVGGGKAPKTVYRLSPYFRRSCRRIGGVYPPSP
jgi:hypothetical protein